jgi:hypothetical protein
VKPPYGETLSQKKKKKTKKKLHKGWGYRSVMCPLWKALASQKNKLFVCVTDEDVRGTEL